MDTEKKAVVANPLLAREVRPVLKLKEFFEGWEASKDFDEMLGRLHTGFNVPVQEYAGQEYDEIDLLIFYFSIADGWTDGYIFQVPADKGKKYQVGYDGNGNLKFKAPSELRQELARKAFDMLCLHFFKKVELPHRHHEDFNNVWERTISCERVLSAIQFFFRTEKGIGSTIKIRNFSYRSERSHGEQHAVSFLLNLTHFMWEWEGLEVPSWFSNKEAKERHNLEMRKRLDSAKPWMIEVLAYLNRLDILGEWLLELDGHCLEKLKEIAMRNELRADRYPFKSRPVATLDEACYVGSKAAWLLKEYELKKSEHQRLEMICAAELKKQEAEQELKKLSRD